MCHLYVKVSQTLVDQIMDRFCRPMLEQIVNTTTKIEFSAGEQAVTFRRGRLLSDFFCIMKKSGYFRGGLLLELYGIILSFPLQNSFTLPILYIYITNHLQMVSIQHKLLEILFQLFCLKKNNVQSRWSILTINRVSLTKYVQKQLSSYESYFEQRN